jgi:predicted DNA-binding protein (MmcQ/YjbR family)
MPPRSAGKRSPALAALAELRAFGLTYPGTSLKSPWPEHLDLVVGDKTFAFLPADGAAEPFRITCKLPQSNALALGLPFVEPAGYGLGKSGWVTATFADGPPPLDLVKAWLDESYRAQAPKTLVKALDARSGGGTPPAAPRRAARTGASTSSGRKSVAKKPAKSSRR